MNSIKGSCSLIASLNKALLRRYDHITYLRPTLLNGNVSVVLPAAQLIHTTPNLQLFWERHRKGGYNRNVKRVSQKELILNGLKELKKEILLWKEEVKEKLECDPILVYRPGETDVMWQFTEENDLENWKVTSDRDHNEGQSFCSFDISPAGHGLFSGNVQSKVPIDGRVKRAGYCNLQSLRARKSFKRDTYWDWTPYNMLVIKLRGDGRSYLLNIASEGLYDVWWNDMFHYVLYTRGGPHWQIAKIPFSKFFLSSKGRVQDKQAPLPLNRISSFGVSVAGRGGHDGPFNLEIDYIGLEFDPVHTEEFAYEMYKQPKYTVAQ
ncbi:Complex I intermediate-associated protein 30, mitochondrial [Pseudolycoriella hygida]|uniref:Complex I intermediate-associated protein 30, mitochondrial n=1 Tax=Pseudolycoriella hygida TaxID=35572 RepID=A0A9Q0MW46_9DIPT|nr:Complex I intermediate-associated protein 30, mitochondrial [Pseudolycoriella hygida]